ncbi:MAG: hypothetical protein O7B35_05105, partial [Deltaproteobacteria bacterium]|nr:hypothetical protein [Deltaproteobacteria bacterium]
ILLQTPTNLSLGLDRVSKNPVLRPVKKDPDARRVRNRRAEVYLGSTSERGGRAQLSQCLPSTGYGRWDFFNNLLDD